MGRTACTEHQCLYSRAKPLLPLWAVLPVQSLSACTVQLNLYSHYGPYGLYRASVHVQGYTLPYLFLLCSFSLPSPNFLPFTHLRFLALFYLFAFPLCCPPFFFLLGFQNPLPTYSAAQILRYRLDVLHN